MSAELALLTQIKNSGGSFPAGAIIDSGANFTITAPDGWLNCDGSIIDGVEYPELSDKLTAVLLRGKPHKLQYDFNFLQTGDITGWTTGTSLPSILSYSQAIVTNSRVYLLGGYTGSSIVSTVYTAPINTDGTLGAWTTGTSLPSILHASQAIVTNSRVYLLGGYNGSSAVSTVYTAQFFGGSNFYRLSSNNQLPNLTNSAGGYKLIKA